MMIEEFEKRTGIFPDMETYRVIEAYYCEFDGDKDAFCKAFKANKKLVENIVQATARDILCYAMNTLRCCSIVMHIHDEVVIEADRRMSLQAVCDQMGRTPPWAVGLLLRADGYETDFYKKD